jgi:hypothetical protein
VKYVDFLNGLVTMARNEENGKWRCIAAANVAVKESRIKKD